MTKVTFIGGGDADVTTNSWSSGRGASVEFRLKEPVELDPNDSFHSHIIRKAARNPFFDVEGNDYVVEKAPEVDPEILNLRKVLDDYGVRYHHKSGVEKLRGQIEAHKELKALRKVAEENGIGWNEEDTLEDLNAALEDADNG